MTLKSLLYKAFVGGRWKVGYRDLHKDAPEEYRFADADLPKGQWVADPFLFELNGKHYLFCEQYEEKLNRAGIGYFVFEDGIPKNKGLIIRQPYHMSYPCVFTHGDQVYMIPETSGNKTIEMYRAVEFPDKWELDAVLLSDAQYVDSTVYETEGKKYLLSYVKEDGAWHLDIFALCMEERKLKKLHRKTYRTNIARPAGFLLETEQGMVRPAQDCSRKYGESMILYRVLEATEEGYREEAAQTICANQLKFPGKVHRVHTLNRDSIYEVVDVFQEKLDLLHGWKILKRSLLHR